MAKLFKSETEEDDEPTPRPKRRLGGWWCEGMAVVVAWGVTGVWW